MAQARPFTEAQIKNAARIVREQGLAVELRRDGSMRILPKGEEDSQADLNPADLVTMK